MVKQGLRVSSVFIKNRNGGEIQLKTMRAVDGLHDIVCKLDSRRRVSFLSVDRLRSDLWTDHHGPGKIHNDARETMTHVDQGLIPWESTHLLA